jgi:hypothetical protein
MQGRAVTSEQTERLLDGLRLGMTRRAACAHAGFSSPTLYRMLEDVALLAAVEKAEGEAEASYTAIIAKATLDPKNWTAAAWWLERRRNQDYARRDKVEMSIDLRTVAARIAEESGLDPDAVMAEAERVLAGQRE